MKWSYTNGKLNVSSDELDQQFTLKELIAEASRHQAYRKKILALFCFLTVSLFLMQIVFDCGSENLRIFPQDNGYEIRSLGGLATIAGRIHL